MCGLPFVNWFWTPIRLLWNKVEGTEILCSFYCCTSEKQISLSWWLCLKIGVFMGVYVSHSCQSRGKKKKKQNNLIFIIKDERVKSVPSLSNHSFVKPTRRIRPRISHLTQPKSILSSSTWVGRSNPSLVLQLE